MINGISRVNKSTNSDFATMECDPGSTNKFNTMIRDNIYRSETHGYRPTIRHAAQDKSLCLTLSLCHHLKNTNTKEQQNHSEI